MQALRFAVKTSSTKIEKALHSSDFSAFGERLLAYVDTLIGPSNNTSGTLQPKYLVYDLIQNKFIPNPAAVHL